MLAERSLGRMHGGLSFRQPLRLAAGTAHGAAGRHQLSHEAVATLGIERTVRLPPEPTSDHEVATVGRRGVL